MGHMTSQPNPNPPTQNPTRQNVDAIAQLERDALGSRSWTERFSESTVKLVGRIVFLSLNVLLMAAWTLINLDLIPGVKSFDRFPFGVLALILSAESIILTIFVLMSQNRLIGDSGRS
jgi:uncharacterized membrane protein